MRSAKTNVFVVMAPDYLGDPFRDVTEDLTLSMWIQFEQGKLLRKAAIEGETTRFSDKIILTKGILDKQDFYLLRLDDDLEQGDSGWFIGDLEDNGDQKGLYALYAYQLLTLKPNIIACLALPKGFMVIIKKDKIKTILNEDGKSISY